MVLYFAFSPLSIQSSSYSTHLCEFRCISADGPSIRATAHDMRRASMPTWKLVRRETLLDRPPHGSSRHRPLRCTSRCSTATGPLAGRPALRVALEGDRGGARGTVWRGHMCACRTTTLRAVGRLLGKQASYMRAQTAQQPSMIRARGMLGPVFLKVFCISCAIVRRSLAVCSVACPPPNKKGRPVRAR